MEQRGAGVAAVCSGELRGSAAVLHTKIKWEGLEVRHGMGKRMENTGGAERLTRAGKESKTAAGKRSSGVELLRPRGTRERETRGGWTGTAWVFIGRNMEGDRAIITGLWRGIGGDSSVRDFRRGRRRRSSRLRHVSLTCGTRMSVGGKEKKRKGAGGFLGLCGMACWAEANGLVRLGGACGGLFYFFD